MGVRSRRATFERALRAAALDQPGLQAHRGHVDSVICRRGRAGGVCVDGSELPADLVIDAPLESASPALRARQQGPPGVGTAGPTGLDTTMVRATRPSPKTPMPPRM
jgi:hypothetical protein